MLVQAWRPGAPAGRARRPAAPAQPRVLRPGTVPCFHVLPGCRSPWSPPPWGAETGARDGVCMQNVARGHRVKSAIISVRVGAVVLCRPLGPGSHNVCLAIRSFQPRRRPLCRALPTRPLLLGAPGPGSPRGLSAPQTPLTVRLGLSRTGAFLPSPRPGCRKLRSTGLCFWLGPSKTVSQGQRLGSDQRPTLTRLGSTRRETQHRAASPLDASETSGYGLGEPRAVAPASQRLARQHTSERLKTDKAWLLTPFTGEESEARGSLGDSAGPWW